ncbi:hypothetical protein GGI25_003674 [Coemansia spiralis]|uniref:Uncharacterized protein n=2 Tax=Coemansia TaxID=4863 RepID=A0A9W8G824_9FUNG|nr:hypothetical protein BX070DRAFT_224116 [Coemansia spiralis]KAJ1991994.1 hypothetical protein EDC05_003149 [Coemansia umbellata]KAJ2625363.1 hypothetical protein GGI26_000834 [Coemansia sp. RSA 1358]KAJ2676168.1 hypothetical protein GGI25_003674 [Coemansia spiralis]
MSTNEKLQEQKAASAAAHRSDPCIIENMSELKQPNYDDSEKPKTLPCAMRDPQSMFDAPTAQLSSKAFPNLSDKTAEDDGFDLGTIAMNKSKRTSSLERASTQPASISGKSTNKTNTDARTRSKSRGRLSAKLTTLITQQQQQHGNSNTNSSDTTIAELQQRLEVMAREKVSLENAIEQEQERMFNQSRRLSGNTSPMAHATTTGGSAGFGLSIGGTLGGTPMAAGAVSPRWIKSHSRSSSVSSFGGASASSVGITETLKADINSLRLKLADAERELVSCYNQSQIYKKELVSLRQRLGMRVDDLYLEDPIPSTIRSAFSDGITRPRRSQSVSSGASSTASTPSSLARRGSGHHHEYFMLPPTTVSTAVAVATTPTIGTAGTPRRISQRPRSVLLSPRRSMEDHHSAVSTSTGGQSGGSLGGTAPTIGFASIESGSLFAPKSSAPQPQRAGRNIK